jgi:hypothetical protein
VPRLPAASGVHHSLYARAKWHRRAVFP